MKINEGQECARARGFSKYRILNGVPHPFVFPLLRLNFFLFFSARSLCLSFQGKYDPAVSQQPSISFEFRSSKGSRAYFRAFSASTASSRLLYVSRRVFLLSHTEFQYVLRCSLSKCFRRGLSEILAPLLSGLEYSSVRRLP